MRWIPLVVVLLACEQLPVLLPLLDPVPHPPSDEPEALFAFGNAAADRKD